MNAIPAALIRALTCLEEAATRARQRGTAGQDAASRWEAAHRAAVRELFAEELDDPPTVPASANETAARLTRAMADLGVEGDDA